MKGDYGEFRAELELAGFACEPSRVTKVVGLRPTYVSTGNKAARRAFHPANRSIWTTQSKSMDRYYIAPHVEWLLERVDVRSPDDLEPLGANVRASVHISIYMEACQGPGAALEVEIMEEIERRGWALNIDLLCLSGESDRSSRKLRRREILEQVHVYSIYPYVSRALEDDLGLELLKGQIAAREFLDAFREGRGYRIGDDFHGFDELTELITDHGREYPAFSKETALVPVPPNRSGEDQTEEYMEPFPTRALCQRLEHAGFGQTHDILRRSTPKSHGTEASNPILDEASTMQVSEVPRAERLVVVLDRLSSGTKLAAVHDLLREAGFSGRIFGFAAGRTVRECDVDEHERFHVEHTVEWNADTGWINRFDMEESSSWEMEGD